MLPTRTPPLNPAKLRPVEGSISDPKGKRKKASGRGEDPPGEEVKEKKAGGSQVPREPSSPPTRHTSVRVVLDFHGVLDLDEEATRRSGRRCWWSQGGAVVTPTKIALLNLLKENPKVELHILSYVGVTSTEKRNQVVVAVQALSRNLQREGVRNKISVTICDRREDKALIAASFEPHVVVDDGYEIVCSYLERGSSHRTVWFDLLYKLRPGEELPRGLTWCKRWDSIVDIISSQEPDLTPHTWAALRPALEGRTPPSPGLQKGRGKGGRGRGRSR